MQAAPFSIDAPAGLRRPVVRIDPADGVPELVELAWGLEPFAGEQKPFRYIRSEGREFPSHRCLIPASEFHVRKGGRSYRVVLASGDWFYFAGIWRPASAIWPEAFAIVTIEANADVQPLQERQGHVILRGQHMAWLQGASSKGDELRPLPEGAFVREEIQRQPQRQAGLTLQPRSGRLAGVNTWPAG
jgi:putative SOS response-associated peptidase YedK